VAIAVTRVLEALHRQQLIHRNLASAHRSLFSRRCTLRGVYRKTVVRGKRCDTMDLFTSST
jgi:hypothetical protein